VELKNAVTLAPLAAMFMGLLTFIATQLAGLRNKPIAQEERVEAEVTRLQAIVRERDGEVERWRQMRADAQTDADAYRRRYDDAVEESASLRRTIEEQAAEIKALSERR
jgi:hypothetical protein